MPSSAIPSKTPAGVDELKHRVRRLSQRHRTVLLLVDGRRSLAEVLGLAHKAGSSTQHFQELLQQDLVELPREPEAPPPPDSGPGALDELPQVTSLDLPVLTVEAVQEPPARRAVDVGHGEVEPVTSPASPALANDGVGSELPIGELRNEAEAVAAEEPSVDARLKPRQPEAEPLFVESVTPPQTLAAWLAAEVELDVVEPDGQADTADEPAAAAAAPARPAAVASAAPAVPAGLPSRPAAARAPAPAALRPQPTTAPAAPTRWQPEPVVLMTEVLEAAPSVGGGPWQPPPATAPATQFIAPDHEAALPSAPLPEHDPGYHGQGDAFATHAAQQDEFEHLELPLPVADEAEDRMLQRVRDLLAETLSFDSPLFAARMRVRVRMAPARRDLVNLVWEIERHLRHTRRSADAGGRLYEARELLGMGNTQVAGESQYGWPDDDE